VRIREVNSSAVCAISLVTRKPSFRSVANTNSASAGLSSTSRSRNWVLVFCEPPRWSLRGHSSRSHSAPWEHAAAFAWRESARERSELRPDSVSAVVISVLSNSVYPRSHSKPGDNNGEYRQYDLLITYSLQIGGVCGSLRRNPLGAYSNDRCLYASDASTGRAVGAVPSGAYSGRARARTLPSPTTNPIYRRFACLQFSAAIQSPNANRAIGD